MDLWMRDLKCGIWNELFGIWNMEYDISDVGNAEYGMRDFLGGLGMWN